MNIIGGVSPPLGGLGACPPKTFWDFRLISERNSRLSSHQGGGKNFTRRGGVKCPSLPPLERNPAFAGLLCDAMNVMLQVLAGEVLHSDLVNFGGVSIRLYR